MKVDHTFSVLSPNIVWVEQDKFFTKQTKKPASIKVVFTCWATMTVQCHNKKPRSISALSSVRLSLGSYSHIKCEHCSVVSKFGLRAGTITSSCQGLKFSGEEIAVNNVKSNRCPGCFSVMNIKKKHS